MTSNFCKKRQHPLIEENRCLRTTIDRIEQRQLQDRQSPSRKQRVSDVVQPPFMESCAPLLNTVNRGSQTTVLLN